MPGDPQLCEAVLTKCSDSDGKVYTPKMQCMCQELFFYNMQFVRERDGCAGSYQKPVYELLSGKLWPVVCLEQVSATYTIYN